MKEESKVVLKKESPLKDGLNKERTHKIVKTVLENKMKIDEHMKGLDEKEMEKVLVSSEEEKLEDFFKLTPEEVIGELEDKEKCYAIHETILYLHKIGSLIQQLQNQHQLSLSKDSEEASVIQYLRTSLEKQTEENKVLKEELEGLTKENNRIQEEHNKIIADLDIKSKKNAELSYIIRQHNTLIKTHARQIDKQAKLIEELKTMYREDEASYIRQINTLKVEKDNLLEVVEEVKAEIKRLGKENETLTRESTMRVEEEKSANVFVKERLNEIVQVTIYSILECSSVLLFISL